jgi:hypothetical protein
MAKAKQQQKAPFAYSEAYRRWRPALVSGRCDEVEELARRHTTQFGPTPVYTTERPFARNRRA